MDPGAGREVGRRHHSKRKGWKAIPKIFILLGILCVALLILIPLAKQNGWFQRPVAMSTGAPAVPSFVSGLELTEAFFDPPSGTIKGKVENKTGRGYRNVDMSFDVRDGSNMEAGLVTASISQLGPHESASFQTTKLASSGRLFLLRELVGEPQ